MRGAEGGDEDTGEEGEIWKREREEDEEELVDLNESDLEREGEERNMTRWRGRDLLVTVKKEMEEEMRDEGAILLEWRVLRPPALQTSASRPINQST